MEIKTQHILVYIDFSSLSENLSHWLNYIYNTLNKPIDLLFVIDHNTAIIFDKTYTRTNIEAKMESFRASCGNPPGNDFIREGCNCSLLSQIAEENDALFCISAVHSHNDVQFLSSSTMVKMLRKSRIPCLIIPRKNQFKTPQRVSLGTNMKRDQKSVAPWLTFLSKHLNLPVLLAFNSNDAAVKTNIHFIERFLKKHDLSYDNIKLKGKFAALDKLCIKRQKTSVIHCLYLKPSAGFLSKIFSDSDAKLLDNPYGQAVFCINPQKDLFVPCT
ncbi:MAG: universal stress protein [Bacteroidota bacterium]|nr:universal stress protein [Bacteroidota bacterium]